MRRIQADWHRSLPGTTAQMAQTELSFEELLETLKVAAAALRDADVPFVLGGGLAIWARGGPETEHDVDFFVKPEDAERAWKALEEVGFRTEDPPEGWLYKGFLDKVMVDLIYAPSGLTIDDEFLERAEELEVHALRMRVMSANDVLVAKLLAMREHQVDYDQVLELARTVREQIDWDEVRERTSGSPFAKAFFTLVDELGVSAGPNG
jgi:predicted nucleotidyltransferase